MFIVATVCEDTLSHDVALTRSADLSSVRLTAILVTYKSKYDPIGRYVTRLDTTAAHYQLAAADRSFLVFSEPDQSSACRGRHSCGELRSRASRCEEDGTSSVNGASALRLMSATFSFCGEDGEPRLSGSPARSQIPIPDLRPLEPRES